MSGLNTRRNAYSKWSREFLSMHSTPTISNLEALAYGPRDNLSLTS